MTSVGKQSQKTTTKKQGHVPQKIHNCVNIENLQQAKRSSTESNHEAYFSLFYSKATGGMKGQYMTIAAAVTNCMVSK